jgi:hypothetical protein
VLRPIEMIAAAILLSRPNLPEQDATRYAKLLQSVANEHGFDPLTGVSIVHHESGWDPTRVAPNGEDYGLGQIRARYIGVCKDDADPLNHPSEACKAVKASLLDPETNLRTMGRLISENRQLCQRKTGSMTLHRWLASYQGRNYPKLKRWCQPGKKTWEVVRYRTFLIDQLSRRKKGQKRPSAPPARPPVRKKS